ncbi:Heme-binding protein HMX1 [Colletotrichum chlorophyti]|uniref:Heme-binding protein HMX1 n=1 Tax=Colletotrichum chlorophyti TaxID=708187 RepID=A0A1Q8RJC6_9PEZI|nr:Heme-binding protein HMX1 [Colletotrichum chlorophyti]
MTSPAVPPAEASQRPLSESIAAATRSVHAKLNKLIIARLPLAIPPHASDPSIYVSGLLHIAPIYITFESLWKAIVESTFQPGVAQFGEPRFDNGPLGANGLTPTSNVEPLPEHRAAVCERTRSILNSLYFPGLMRSDRLRSDIASLTGWSPEMVDEQLRAVSESGRLADFTMHVKRMIEKKPHVLLAYAYILFMALFAGGRFIRATLESAGSEFWDQVPAPIPPSQTACRARSPLEDAPITAAGPVDLSRGGRGTGDVGAKHSRHSLPLSFFHFATVLDGEDLKKEFKKRLAEAESILTAHEKHDVVQEAVCIFDSMLLLVSQLDNACDTNLEDQSSGMAAWAALAPGGRLRDSVAVARERRGKAASKEMGDSENSNSWLFRHITQRSSSETSGSSGLTDLEKQPPACCPASKSMRFEANLPVPDRKGLGKTASANAQPLPMHNRQLSRSAVTVIFNIILVAGLAAAVGMLLFSRRLVKTGLTVEEEW